MKAFISTIQVGALLMLCSFVSAGLQASPQTVVGVDEQLDISQLVSVYRNE
jgi:hypothetical protein